MDAEVRRGVVEVVHSWASARLPPPLAATCDVSEVIQRLWGGYGLLCRVNVNVRQSAAAAKAAAARNAEAAYADDDDAEDAVPPQAGPSSVLGAVPPATPHASMQAAVSTKVSSSSSPLPPPVVVCKYIVLPLANTARALPVGDARKRRSYAVEATFYRHVAPLLPAQSVVPIALAAHVRTDGPPIEWAVCPGCRRDDVKATDARMTVQPPPSFLILTDLRAAGFTDARPNRRRLDVVRGALRWLAGLHAPFLANPRLLDGLRRRREAETKQPSPPSPSRVPEKTNDGVAGLWPQGQYWHLGTRGEELKGLVSASRMAGHAADLDRALMTGPLTVVHGDAKLPNFLFKPQSDDSGDDVRPAAAVDFQYAGLGSGISDVAYLLHSTLESAFDNVAGHSSDDEGNTDQFSAVAGTGNRKLRDHEAASYASWSAGMAPYVDFYLTELTALIKQFRATKTDTIAGQDRHEEDRPPPLSPESIADAYRALFEVAYLDYWRFYLGWAMPNPMATEERMMASAPAFVRHMLRQRFP